MLLVNSSSKTIIHYNGQNPILLKGEFNILRKYIDNKYKKIHSKYNLYINNNLINKTFQFNQDIIIIDLYRHCNIYISQIFYTSFGIENILKILYNFDNSYNSNQEEITLYGSLNIHNNNLYITDIKQLLDLGFYKINISKDNGMYIYNYFFSYGLGQYKEYDSMINSSRGVDKKKHIAREKGLSEAIERLSASFEENIYPYNKHNKYFYINYIDRPDFEKNKTNGQYIPIHSIGYNNKTLYCPYEIIYYPVKYKFLSAISNSNGMATHISTINAKINGILELIERDAFILMRLLQTGIQRININKYKSNSSKIIKLQKLHNIEIYSFVICFDNPLPVIVLLATKNKKSIIVSGAGFTITHALNKAYQELTGMIDFFYIDINLIKSNPVMDHIIYYLNEENFSKIEWLTKLKIKRKRNNSFSLNGRINNKNLFDKIINYYKKINIHFYQYQYKNHLNKYYNRKTIRILSDQLLPIYFENNIPFQILESERLLYWKKKSNIKDINTNFQPFG